MQSSTRARTTLAVKTTAKREENGVCKTEFVDERRVRDVNRSMPNDDVIDHVADSFGALADPTRVRILYALSMHELCVCDLSRILARSMPATSHALQHLRRLRLVKYRMDGKLAYYSLRAPWLRDVLAAAIERGEDSA